MAKDAIRKVRVAKELPFYRVGDKVDVHLDTTGGLYLTNSFFSCSEGTFRMLVKDGILEEIDLTLNPKYCSWYYKPDVYQYRLGCRDIYVKEEFVEGMKYCPYCAKKINWVNNLPDKTIEEIK